METLMENRMVGVKLIWNGYKEAYVLQVTGLDGRYRVIKQFGVTGTAIHAYETEVRNRNKSMGANKPPR